MGNQDLKIGETKRLVRVKWSPADEMVTFCPECPVNRVAIDGKQTACLYGNKESKNSDVLTFIKCDFYKDGSIGNDDSGNKTVVCTK